MAAPRSRAAGAEQPQVAGRGGGAAGRALEPPGEPGPANAAAGQKGRSAGERRRESARRGNGGPEEISRTASLATEEDASRNCEMYLPAYCHPAAMEISLDR